MASTLPVGQEEKSAAICKRCNKEEATLQIRSEPVCQSCFVYYVNTKAVKRMETYKSKGVKKFLLPVSLGTSSICLLHILNEQLQRQLEKNNRLSYELTVAYVDLNFNSAEASAQAQSHWAKVQERYSSHKYVKVGIEDALDLDTIKWSSLGLDTTLSDKSIPKKDRLQTLLKSIPAATSRADISTTLLSSLLVDVAKGNSCDSILFGDSTTRLAEKTLTETAKGRGFSLPWQVSDGESPFEVHYRYPLRDILKKELVSFAALTSPPLTDLIIPTAPMSALVVSSKNTTIDDLMTQYFESVEENYPSIVANVVRTSSKLKAPSVDDTTRCSLCGVPVASGTEGIHGWGGDQSFNAAPLPSSESSKHGILCYGCSRSING